MSVALLNLTTHDGSRQFLAIRADCSYAAFERWTESLPEATVSYMLPTVTEMWLDFSFRGQRFTVNDQFGEFWFFVSDPHCAEDILLAVAEHFTSTRPPPNPALERTGQGWGVWSFLQRLFRP